MTIDEAIAFCHEKSNNIKLKAEPQVFIQLAEWLEELKAYRNHVFSGEMTQSMLKEERNKAIDDFKKILTIEKIKEYAESDGFINLNNCSLMIFDIAEQLKAGGKNEN